MPSPQNREETLLALALEKPADTRPAFLDGACLGDDALRQRLEALLAARDKPKPLPPLDAPAPADKVGPAETIAPSQALGEKPGDRIGRYQLLEKVGQGGCGVVYVAEQIEPVRRRVALKVVKLGMDTKEVMARFEGERQALALMDHPHIAKIFDAGATDAGRPYFVMELVQGVRITQFCDERQLSVGERLDLFILVCRAIQHAHQKGIIHRDIKPSNILVTMHDGVPVPKVIDFGIAKATEGRLTEATIYTQIDQFIGTPTYMSPEQVDMCGRDIDTCSDVYSLGVVLYELLAGVTPFDAFLLTASGLDTMRRTIREMEPVRPSTRFATLKGQELTMAAKHRSADISKVVRQLKGDLDWIVMKCLEKDRTRRYDTANGLAMDVQRHLAGEAVEAAPPSTAYQIRKFVRRHRVGVIAGLLVAVALVLGVMGTTGGMFWALRERDRANVETAKATRAARLEAQARRQAEEKQAEGFAAAGHTPDAMAIFARFLRETPGDVDVASRLISMMEMRAFPMPALPPMQHGVPVPLARMDHEGKHLITVADDSVLRSWSLKDGTLEKQAKLNLATSELRWFPDGIRLLVVSRQGRIIIWDSRRWQLERELGTVPIKYQKVAMSGDGQLVASLNLRSEVELWETASGRLLSHTKLPEGVDLLASAIGPDGEAVLSSQAVVSVANKGLWLWRPRTGELLTLPPTNGSPVCVTCDWPRRRVFAGLESKGLVCLDLDTCRELKRNPDETEWHNILVAADGKHLLVSRWGLGVSVVDAATLQEQVAPFAGSPVAANVSPDEKFRIGYRALHDGTGRLYDLGTGQPLMEPIQHEGAILSHELSPDGGLLITASQDGTGRLWDMRMRAAESELIHGNGWVNGMDLSPDGQRLAVAREHQARVYDIVTWKPMTPPMTCSNVVFKVKFSPDGRRLATASYDRTARVWDSMTGEAVGPGDLHEGRVWLGVFSPDGRRVASASEDGTARVFDVATGKSLFPPLKHETQVIDVCFSPDGSLLATASVDATARLWDANTGAAFGPVLRHAATVWTARFSADGRQLLTASSDRTAQLWDVKTGLRAAPPIRSDQSVLGAELSHDGRRVLISTLTDARIFDAQTSEPLTPPMWHANRVWYARFSPDGRWVATASEDNTARIWNAKTGFPVTEPLTHRAMVTSLSWLPDSRRLLTGSQDGTVRLWKRPDLDSVPPWLADLAEALAGKQQDSQGGHSLVQPDRLDALRRMAETNLDDTPQNRWLRWFLIERVKRTAP